MLAIARCLMDNPMLVLMDGPGEGLVREGAVARVRVEPALVKRQVGAQVNA